MQAPETETQAAENDERSFDLEELQTPKNYEEPAAIANSGEFKRLGIDKIEEMERQLKAEQAQLKARLDARKQIPSSANLFPSEETKTNYGQVHNHQSIRTFPLLNDNTSTGGQAKNETVHSPEFKEQRQPRTTASPIRFMPQHQQPTELKTQTNNQNFKKSLDSIVIQNNSLLTDSPTKVVTKDEFEQLRGQVNEIKEILLSQQAQKRRSPSCGDQKWMPTDHQQRASFDQNLSSPFAPPQMSPIRRPASPYYHSSNDPPMHMQMLQQQQQHQQMTPSRSMFDHQQQLYSSQGMTMSMAADRSDNQQHLLTMSVFEKQSQAMQQDLNGKQTLIEGQQRQIYLLQQQLNMMSTQLEEVAREKHITEVKFLKQSQQMNAVLEDNSMLRRHMQMQQTNLNHYRLSQTMPLQQSPRVMLADGGGVEHPESQNISSARLLGKTSQSSTTLERLRQERMRACGSARPSTQHYIGDYTFSKDQL